MIPPFNDPEPAPPGGDPTLIARLAADLRALPYTAASVEELLRPVVAAALDREQAAAARRRVTEVMDDAGAPASQRALAAVVSCWMLGDRVPVTALEAALPSLGAEGAAALGLGWIRDGHLHPVLDLSPYSTDDAGDLWVASDQTALQTRATLPPWHVVGIGRASLTLAGNIVRTPVRRALDLGTGCGIQTLHLLAHAEHVTATDLSERALAFTAFTLRLNAESLGLAAADLTDGALAAGGGRVTLLAGDLLEPVAGQRFDLVVSNPPFVITPRQDAPDAAESAESAEPAGATGSAEPAGAVGSAAAAGINTYRDGGRPGDSLFAELVARLPEHLEPGGTVQMLGNWEIHGEPDATDAPDAVGTGAGDPAGEPDAAARVPGAESPQLPGWEVRPRSWVPDGVDAWFIQRDVLDPAGYAETWLQDSSEQLDQDGYAAGYHRYLEDFARRGVAGVGFGYLWLRCPVPDPQGRQRPGRIRTEVLESELQQPLGPAWGAAVQRWDRVRDADAGPESLRPVHLQVPGDVTEERYQRFGAEHPEVILARQGGGFRRTARLDTATAGFLAAADGELEVGQLTGALAGLLGLDAAGESALVAAVADLYEQGFLIEASTIV